MRREEGRGEGQLLRSFPEPERAPARWRGRAAGAARRCCCSRRARPRCANSRRPSANGNVPLPALVAVAVVACAVVSLVGSGGDAQQAQQQAQQQARQQAQQQARLAQLLALFAHHEAMFIVIAQAQQAAAPAAAGQLAAMQQQLSAAMLVKGKNVQRSCLAWSARDRSEAHDEGRKRDEQRAD